MLRKVALGALALTLSFAAYAADLGSNGGLADLEERVAELEATTARKGNRKVSVTVYGQINRAIMFHDADVSKSFAKAALADGAQNPTFFGLMGEGKVSANVKVGFKIEFGMNELVQSDLGPLDDLANTVAVRQSNVWIESAQLGRLTVGKASTASDGIAEITVSNTDVAAKMLNIEPIPTTYLTGSLLTFDGDRRNVVRFDSPSLGGFIVSASYGHGDRIGPFSITGDASDAVWDVAIRYAGEFAGFRVAAGVGYRFEDYNAGHMIGPFTFAGQSTAIAGSASAKHLASGLFVNVAAGKVDDLFGTGGPDLTGYHAQGGWEKNVTGVGNTTLFAEWATLKMTSSDDRNLIGAGVIQAFDAGALDIYASWRRIENFSGVGDDINTFMGGVRIRF